MNISIAISVYNCRERGTEASLWYKAEQTPKLVEELQKDSFLSECTTAKDENGNVQKLSSAGVAGKIARMYPPDSLLGPYRFPIVPTDNCYHAEIRIRSDTDDAELVWIISPLKEPRNFM